MKLLVGLGNPGAKYENSRHNMGFMALDRVAALLNAEGWKSECGALVAKARTANGPVLLAKPQTFMNLSGRSVAKLLGFYKLELADLLVLVDDMELEPGRVRARDQGSHGGHNGLRSIEEWLATREYKRIRIGIGRPAKGTVVSHVLSESSPEETLLLEEGVEAAAKMAVDYTQKDCFENRSSP